MKKKTIITLSLISAVLSFFYIILNYYGFLRYIGIKIFPVERYFNNNKNLDKIHKNNKIVISIMVDDINKKSLQSSLNSTIKSLLDQTIAVDFISITFLNKLCAHSLILTSSSSFTHKHGSPNRIIYP